MNVLVATTQTQGQRFSDFCWVPEGEIVHFVTIECSREPVDGGCGCKRAMVGALCRKSTTTIQVVERPDLTVADLTTVILTSLTSSGWVKEGEVKGVVWARKDALELARVAASFPVGTVLEKRGRKFQTRTTAPGVH